MLNKNNRNDVLLICIAVFFALLFGFRVLLSCVLPFAAAYLPASMTRRCGERIAKKLRLSRPFSVGVVTTVLLTAVSALFFVLFREGVRELLSAARSFDIDAFSAYLTGISDRLGALLGRISPKTYARLASDGHFEAWTTAAANRLAAFITEALLGAVGAFPRLFLALAVTVLAVFYFALDHAKIVSFFNRLLPEDVCCRIRQTKDACFSGIRQMLGAYTVLLLMTFAELVTGFVFIGVPYAVLLAFLIAVVDILPVLGTGTVLVPWALVTLLSGDARRGIALLALCGIITVVRQIAEPRIVGRSVGLHPLVTLAAMYVGCKIGGVAGLLLFPFGAAVTANVLGQRDAKEG